MLILLPPSEGKSTSRSGRPLDLASLSLPALHAARERLVSSIVDLCSGDAEGARRALGLSAGQDEEIVRNTRLRSAPTLPASRLYTGVLYEALDLVTLPAAAKRRAQRSIVIFSGLWGAVRLGDRLPPYRCSVTARLPGIGGVASPSGPASLGGYWRRELTGVLDDVAGTGPVLDLRSNSYTPMWTPSEKLAGRTVTVRVLHERVERGTVQRVVVSHFNKATKGRLVRGLLGVAASPTSVAGLVAALRGLGYAVEQAGPGRLDVVVT